MFSRRQFLVSMVGLVAASKKIFGRAATEPIHLPDRSITPNEAFFTLHYSPTVPQISLDHWRLRLGGLRDGEEISLNWRDLMAMPAVTQMHTLECIGNTDHLIGNAVWRGVRLQTLLNQVQMKPDTWRVKFTAYDGYQTAVDLHWLLHPDTLLAYEMNGQPLTREQGFPLRLLIPGLYGQKMPKWLHHIQFINTPFKGYWESRGWSDTAAIQTHALITSPHEGAQINSTTLIQGIALASLREIKRVEIRINGGAWQPTEVTPGVTPSAWSTWQYEWQPTVSGRVSIEARAADSAGFVQFEESTGRLKSPKPNGSVVIQKIWVRVNSG